MASSFLNKKAEEQRKKIEEMTKSNIKSKKVELGTYKSKTTKSTKSQQQKTLKKQNKEMSSPMALNVGNSANRSLKNDLKNTTKKLSLKSNNQKQIVSQKQNAKAKVDFLKQENLYGKYGLGDDFYNKLDAQAQKNASKTGVNNNIDKYGNDNNYYDPRTLRNRSQKEISNLRQRAVDYNAAQTAEGFKDFQYGVDKFSYGGLTPTFESSTSGNNADPRQMIRYTDKEATKKDIEERRKKLEQEKKKRDEERAKLEQIASEIGVTNADKTVGKAFYTLGQMAPTIAIGMATGGLGLPTGISNLLTLTPMSLSAAGLSQQQAEDEGATQQQARLFGIGSGVKEAATEMMFGGIGGIGKTLGTKGYLDKAVVNAVGERLGNSFGADIAGEVIEELVSNYGETGLKRLIYDSDAKLPTAKENLDTIIDTALSTVLLKGVSAPVGIYRQNRLNDKIRQAEETAELNEKLYNLAAFNTNNNPAVNVPNEVINSMMQTNIINNIAEQIENAPVTDKLNITNKEDVQKSTGMDISNYQLTVPKEVIKNSETTDMAVIRNTIGKSDNATVTNNGTILFERKIGNTNYQVEAMPDVTNGNLQVVKTNIPVLNANAQTPQAQLNQVQTQQVQVPQANTLQQAQAVVPQQQQTTTQQTTTQQKPILNPKVETPKVKVTDVATLNNVAKTLGNSGERAMITAYDGNVDTGEYAEEFIKVYNSAKNGIAIPKTTILSQSQIFAAQSAGLNDSNVNIDTEGREYLEGLFNEGSIGSISQSAGGQSGTVQERATSIRKEWEIRGIPKDNGRKNFSYEQKTKINAKKLVNRAVEGQEVYIEKEAKTDEMKKAKILADRNNYAIIQFTGQDIRIENGTDIRGFADTDTKEMGVRADNPEATAYDLACHETMELKLSEGEFTVDDVLESARGLVDGWKIDYAINLYLNGNPSMSEYEATKELVCDGADHINQLRYSYEQGYISLKETVELLDEVIEAINTTVNEMSDNAFVVDDSEVENSENTAISENKINKPTEQNLEYSAVLMTEKGPIAVLEEAITIKKNETIQNAIKRFFNENLKGKEAHIKSSGETAQFDQIGKYLYPGKKPIRKAKVKYKAVSILEDMVSIGTNKQHEPDYRVNGEKKKHGGYNADRGFDYYDTKFAIDNSGDIYNGTIIIRKSIDGKDYFYDLTIKKEIDHLDVSKMLNPSNLGQSLEDNIQQSNENVNDNQKFSSKIIVEQDNKGRKLSEGQQEYFKNSKVVDDNGNLITVYHGTNRYGFTIFNRNTNYFTDNKNVAKTYTNSDSLYEGYVNIENPITINVNGEKWSMIAVDDISIDGISNVEDFLNKYGASTWKEKRKLRTSTADIVSAIEEAIDNGEVSADGIIIENIYDEGSYSNSVDNEIGTDYIVFNSNQFKRADNENPTNNDDIRFSSKIDVGIRDLTQKEITKEYQKTVDDILSGNKKVKGAVLLGYTPSIYTELGMPSLPFVIGAGHIYSAAKTENEAKAENKYTKGTHYHGLGETAIKNIYEAVQKPVAIISAKDVDKNTTPMRSTHSVVAIIDIGTKNNSLLIPVEITAERTVNGQRMDVNLVSSVYERNVANLLEEAIAQENIGEKGFYYIKKETTDLLIGAGVQFSKQLQKAIASDGIVRQFDEKVNMKVSKQTESLQFKKWFGDWQNNPDKASKVVNEDGTPKVMYHGSAEQFIAFDKKKAKSSGFYGKGFYFTDDINQAGIYGNTYAVYLDIKNPLKPGNSTATAKQVRKFLEAVAENEDYSIENYGTYDVNQILNNVMNNKKSGDVFSIINDINSTAIGDFVEAIKLFNTVNKTNYDGIIVPTETVVFEPIQIKSATDNVGTFDRNNDKTTFSTKLNIGNDIVQKNRELNEQYKKLKSLQKELAKQTKKADYWKGQTKVTKELSYRADDVKKFTKNFLSDYDSKIPVADINERMTTLANHFANVDIEYIEAKEQATSIARDIINNVSVLVDDTNKQIYDELKSDLARTKLRIPINETEDIGDFREYKKSIPKEIKVIVTDNATDGNIDNWYDEKMKMYPWLFPEINGAGGKLRQIVDVMQNLEPVFVNPYSYDMAEAIEECSNDIMDRLIYAENLRYNPPTYADKMTAKIEAEKQKGNEKVAREKAKANERVEKEKAKANEQAIRREYQHTWEMLLEKQRSQEQKEKLNQKIKEVRQQRDAKIDSLKQHYKQEKINRAESKARDRLLQIARRLNNKKLPTVNRTLIDAYIKDLDLFAKSISIKNIDKLSNLQDWYNNERLTNPNFIPNEAIEKKIARLSKKQINDLSIDEVVDLTETLLTFEHAFRTENKLINSMVKKELSNAAFQTINDIENSKGSKDKFFTKHFIVETLTPEREARRVTGYVDDDPLNIAVRELSIGQRQMNNYIMNANKPMEKILNDEPFMRWFTGKHAEEIEIGGIDIKNGKPIKVKITPAMRVGLYLHSLNYDNLRHIQDGGITIPNMQEYKRGDLTKAYNNGKTIRLTVSDVRQITSEMTEKERKLARLIQDYFAKSTEEINKTSEQLVGYEIAKVENYYPIDTDKSFLRTDFEALKYDGTIEGMGFTKERVRASNPIMLYDVNSVANKSINQHAKYVGLAIPVRNFNKLWNTQIGSFTEDGKWQVSNSIANAIKGKWGESSYNYMEKLIKDISNPNKKADSWSKSLNKVRSNYARAVLELNLSVAIKQTASYPTAAAVVGWKPLAKALASKNTKYDIIDKYTSAMWERRTGLSSLQEIGELSEQGKKLPKLLNWIQGMDVFTTHKLFKACEYYVKDNLKIQPGTDAYMSKVVEIYENVIENTQPQYSIMQRPEILRSDNEVVKFLNMFKTQPFQNFNILYDSINNLRAKKVQNANLGTKESKKALHEAKVSVARAISSQLVSGFVFGLMQFSWDLFRGNDDKYSDEDGEIALSTWLKGMGINMASNGFGMLPFGSVLLEFGETLTDTILEKLEKDPIFNATMYGFDVPVVGTANDTMESVIKIIGSTVDVMHQAMDEENTEGVDWEDYLRSIYKSSVAITQLFGLPVNNVKNTFEGAVNTALKQMFPKNIGEYYGLRITTSPKYTQDYYKLLFKTKDKDFNGYNEIYNLMIDSGKFTEVGIKNAFENKWKEEQKVEHVDELEYRWVKPSEEKSYRQQVDTLRSSIPYQNATPNARKTALGYVYKGFDKSDDNFNKKMAQLKPYGITSGDYELVYLARDLFDQPNKKGNLGTYTDTEKAYAIAYIGKQRGFTAEQMSALYGVFTGKQFKNNWSSYINKLN